MNDPRAVTDLVAGEWRRFRERLAAHPEAWDRPTRCAGWTVADLAAHTVWGTSLEADGLDRARRGLPGPAEGLSPADDADRDRVLALLASTCDRLVTGLDALAAGAGPDADLPMPYGPLPVDLALSVFAMEAGVHGSDLAAALGLDDTLGAGPCAGTVATLAVFGPAFAAAAGSKLAPGAVIELRSATGALRFAQERDGAWTAAADGPATAVVTGPDSDVWLFAVGRRPADAPGLVITGDAALARSFKALVPGP